MRSSALVPPSFICALEEASYLELSANVSLSVAMNRKHTEEVHRGKASRWENAPAVASGCNLQLANCNRRSGCWA